MDIYPKIPIPKGMRIWSADKKVAGTSFRFNSVLQFIKNSEHQLSFEPDPNNPKDSNAIKVIGHYRNGVVHLGFVDKETTQTIADLNLINLVLPRLDRIWLSDDQKKASLEYSILIHRKYYDSVQNGVPYNADTPDLESEKLVAGSNKSPLPPRDKPKVYPPEKSYVLDKPKSGLTKFQIFLIVLITLFLLATLT